MDRHSRQRRLLSRRRKADRRRKLRTGPNRRRQQDRRSAAADGVNGSSGPADAAAAEPSPAASSSDVKISLYDIVLRSAGLADARILAFHLEQLKIAPSADAACQMLAQAPATLGRYFGRERAEAAAGTLRAAGADVALETSVVTCPHCAAPVACGGELDGSSSGVKFVCAACSGAVLLDPRDKEFHPLLRCSACQALLKLPARPRPGRYRCKCGRILYYDQLRNAAESGPDIRFQAEE